jgi:hypothetical protein
MKKILNNTFIQLIGIYSVVILLISIGLFWKYSLQFHIAAIIIAILGALTIKDKTKIKLPTYLILLPIILTLVTRIIPYLNNTIPLGYDAGIYKFGIENFSNYLFGCEEWIRGALTPGFLYLTTILNSILNTNTILTTIFIIFNLILGFSIYFTTKEYFNKTTGILAFLLYSISLIQFKVFTYMYYKNIIAISTLLWSLYFLKKQKRIPFIILSALTGILHRPTFFILGLSYLAYIITNRKNLKQKIINGILILAITAIFYIGFFKQSILPLIKPVAQSFINTGTAPGTFINFFTYQYSVLAYLPLAILGFFYLIKKKQYNMLFFWTLINVIIVYFQFFFFNRFIIMLDIALIILAAQGFHLLIQNKKKVGTIITIMLFFSLSFVTINEAINTNPLITEKELETIQQLNNTEENSFVMATSSLYSPYVLGYSNRNTIAPGLFQYNQHNEQEWIVFWTTNNLEEIKEFMNIYENPLYIHIGQKQNDNLNKFQECFEIYYENEKNKIYKYAC